MRLACMRACNTLGSQLSIDGLKRAHKNGQLE